MTDVQYRKIGDVIHTLVYVRDGKAVDVPASMNACIAVLNEVLNLELKRRKGDPR